MRSFLLAFSLVVLTGCASTMSPAELAAMPSERLCTLYSSGNSPAMRAELQQRGVLNSKEWAAIDDDAIFTGMSRTAVFCLLGHPGHTINGKINTTVVAGRKSEQFVYRKSMGPAIYVYVQNGFVTSWQY